MLIVSLEEMTKITITIAHNQLAHNNSSGSISLKGDFSQEKNVKFYEGMQAIVTQLSQQL